MVAPNQYAARIALFVESQAVSAVAAELSALAEKEFNRDDLKTGLKLRLSPRRKVICHLLTDDDESIQIARTKVMSAIVIDNRHKSRRSELSSSLIGRVIPELLASGDRRPVKRNSIIALIGSNKMASYHAYAVGTLQLGGVLVDPADMRTALSTALKISRPQKPGKVALCLAGGGIEGLFWEIGVLRALDKHLKNASSIDFDIFSGISAGGLLSAFLANGIQAYEITNALYGNASRIEPINKEMLFAPNIKELTSRAISAAIDLAKGNWLMRPLDSAMKSTPTALFSGDKLKSYLHREFSKSGMYDDFARLNKELFIGTTDQDTGDHVIFGTGQNADVPISTAVRASTAMTPYYGPEKIKDRYYIDGIFTRTIDIDVAVAHGATMIICVDPLRPYQTNKSGYVSGKGGLFNTVQSVKSMIRTRLSEMINKAEETHPNISVYVFSPSAQDMEQMSGTMMRYFYNTDTENMAFESACKQIEKDKEWLAEDLGQHGYKLI